MAKQRVPYTYPRAMVIKTGDGDTMTLLVDQGLHGFRRETLRLRDIDCFEVTRRGNWDSELDEEEIWWHMWMGREAGRLVAESLPHMCYVRIDTFVNEDREKYGRFLACVSYPADPIFTGYPDEHGVLQGELLHLADVLREADFAKRRMTDDDRAKWAAMTEEEQNA